MTPSLAGYTFSPVTAAVICNGTNVTVPTFTATAAPGLVQTAATISDAAATTISQAFSSANTASNLIVVTTSWGTKTASPTVTDTLGNTYVLATTGYSAAGDQSLAIYYAKNILGGANTVTVNFAVAAMHGCEYWFQNSKGSARRNPVDVTAQNSGSATTAANNATSTAATTTSAGDLIFGAIENYNVDGTVSAGSGFTFVNSLGDTAIIETAIETGAQTTPGAIAATFTFADADGYLAQMVAFRPATVHAPSPTYGRFQWFRRSRRKRSDVIMRRRSLDGCDDGQFHGRLHLLRASGLTVPYTVTPSMPGFRLRLRRARQWTVNGASNVTAATFTGNTANLPDDFRLGRNRG